MNREDYYYDSKKGKLIVNRIRRARHDKVSGLPSRYASGLTPSKRRQYKKSLEASKRYYQRTGLVKGRKPVAKNLKYRRSKHIVDFEKRYGFSINDDKKIKKLFPDTDVKAILGRGIAAYASGSRPTMTGRGAPYGWARARLASALLGRKAAAVDAKYIGPNSLRVIYEK